LLIYLLLLENKGSQLSGYSKHAALEKERESDKYNLEMKGSDVRLSVLVFIVRRVTPFLWIK
jgi:hypothetical protein